MADNFLQYILTKKKKKSMNNKVTSESFFSLDCGFARIPPTAWQREADQGRKLEEDHGRKDQIQWTGPKA